jgi:hypothetical protein
MTEALGSQVYGEANHEVFLGRDYGATPDYSDATARRIDDEVARIMGKAHEVAVGLLESRRAQMDLMVEVLMERETVEGQALEALLNNTWDDYLEHEDEILAKKAEDERKQIADDERHAAEQKARELEKLPPPTGADQMVAATLPASAPNPKVSDVFAGKADSDEFTQTLLGDEAATKDADTAQATKTAKTAPKVKVTKTPKTAKTNETTEAASKKPNKKDSE